MFHDPSLERTTNGKGLIKQQPWHDGIEHVRTVAKPQQQLPTFKGVCDLLMKPENRHVKLNVSSAVQCSAVRRATKLTHPRGHATDDDAARILSLCRSTSSRKMTQICCSD